VELIHLASLIHDDILDAAETRRTRPTMNAKWGTEVSVLLGDCLFAHALKLCADFENRSICREIAAAANEVCTGEILQTQRRFDLKFTVADYLRVIRMKTGALFRAGAELSARVAGLPDSVSSAYRVYGESLGIAYQIYDDCLDMFGTEKSFGKTLGTDLRRGKLTLPVLHMLRQLGPDEIPAVSKAILDGTETDRQLLAERVIEAGGLAFARRKAVEFLNKSSRSLEGFPFNEALEALRKIPVLIALQLDKDRS
jgi:octaprenyl-diphosphate synthase